MFKNWWKWLTGKRKPIRKPQRWVKPRLEGLEDRLAPAVVNIDPGAYIGQYSFSGQARQTGPSTIDLGPGTYNLNINHGTLSFAVDGIGNVTSNNTIAATATGNTLRFNTTTINVDPSAYTGQYNMGDTNLHERVTGTRSFTVLPGFNNYTVTINHGYFGYNVDASGNITSHNTDAASATGNTLHFNTTTVSVDPGAYTGQYNMGDTNLHERVTGARSFTVLPGFNNFTVTINHGYFGYNVDASGNITSHNTDAASATSSTLHFNTTTISVDPGAYTGQYNMGDTNLHERVTGPHSFTVLPGFINYTVVINHGYFGYNVDAAGNITSQNPDTAEATGNTLLFHTTTINVDPGAYTGQYNVGDVNLHERVTGTRSFIVLPAFNNYTVVIDHGYFGYNVDVAGNVTSQNPTTAEGTGNTLFFHTTTINVDPAGFADPYNMADVSRYSPSTGYQSFTVLPAFNNYIIVIGPDYFGFNVDAAGNVISHDPLKANGSGNTLVFNTSSVKRVVIDPGAYTGQFSVASKPRVTGTFEVDLLPGRNNIYINHGYVSFLVNSDGTVTSDNPTAVTATGNTLHFNTTTISVDPGAYIGQYNMGEINLYERVTGSRTFIVLPGFNNYFVTINHGYFGFNVDASGSITSHNTDAASATGNTLHFNTTTVSVDPGAYTGQYNMGDVNLHERVTGARSFTVLPGFNNYTVVINHGYFGYNVDASGVITSQNPVTAHGSGNTLVFHTTSINVEPAAYVGFYNMGDINLHERVVGVHSFILLPGFNNYTVTIDHGYFTYNVDASGNVVPHNANQAEGIGNLLRFRTITINVDPSDFIGVYNMADVSLFEQTHGPKSFIVIPDFNNYIVTIDNTYFGFNVDAAGNVTSQNSARATGVGNTLRFNTVTVHIDPGAFTGYYYSPQINPYDVITGPQTLGFFTGATGLEIYFFDEAIVFDVDANGNVINHTPQSATASGNTLTFRTTTIHIEPGDYVSQYDAAGYEPVQGPQTIGVVLNTNLGLNIGYGWLLFRVDEFGVITPDNLDAVSVVDDTIFFNTSSIHVDPGTYLCEYLFAGLNGDAPLFGPKDFVIVPGLEYPVSIGEEEQYVLLDAAGEPTPTELTFDLNGQPVTITFSTTPASSTDTDGVIDAVELLAPNGGDGNGDGTLDAEQDNVASLPGSVNGNFITVAAEPGASLTQVAIQSALPVAGAPEAAFPNGIVNFHLENLTPGAATTVTLFFANGQLPTTYYKFGPTADEPNAHWYEFLFDGTTGAEILADRVILHLVDGQRGDNDQTANGVIIDPGAPSVATTSVTFDPGDYEGRYAISGGAFVRGKTTLQMTPGTYTFHLPSDSFTFSIDPFGVVTSNNPAAATGGKGMLQLQTTLVTINQGNYRGAVTLDGESIASNQATQTLHLVYNTTGYALDFAGVTGARFDVSRDGSAISRYAPAAHAEGATLFLHTTTVTIERNGYDGYLGVANYATGNTAGDAKFILITGLAGYTLTFGGDAKMTFDLDATGHTISRNTGAADATLATLQLHTASVHVDVKNYSARWSLGATEPVNSGPDFTLVVNIDNYAFQLGDEAKVTFKVNADGSVTSHNPQAVAAAGNQLKFQTMAIAIDPGAYRGVYNLGATNPGSLTGGNVFVLVKNVANYRLIGPNGLIGRFSLDATGKPTPASLITTIGGKKVTFKLTTVSPTLTITGPAKGVRGQARTFIFSAKDVLPAGVTTTFTYAIDWNGDGVVDQMVQGGAQIIVDHVFTDAKTYTVKAIATDRFGTVSSIVSRSIVIQSVATLPDQANASLTNLVIGGTTGKDKIALSLVGGQGVRVTINGINFGVFYPTGRILIYGQGGSDTITTDNAVLAAWLKTGKAPNRRWQ